MLYENLNIKNVTGEEEKWITYQVLDSIKVIFNCLVTFRTGLSVDLQALHEVFLKVCVNLQTGLLDYLQFNAVFWTLKTMTSSFMPLHAGGKTKGHNKD